MQPIIRRTITITETWTITWADGYETACHETREVAVPAVQEPKMPLPPLIDNEELDKDVLEREATDSTAADE